MVLFKDWKRDDEILKYFFKHQFSQKINIYHWVKEEHLDIPPVSESGKRFLKLAQQGENYHGFSMCGYR